MSKRVHFIALALAACVWSGCKVQHMDYGAAFRAHTNGTASAIHYGSIGDRLIFVVFENGSNRLQATQVQTRHIGSNHWVKTAVLHAPDGTTIDLLDRYGGHQLCGTNLSTFVLDFSKKDLQRFLNRRPGELSVEELKAFLEKK